ncbi:bifunctional tetrahydrofolate synthase/dihydrofolate synthase [Pseudomonas sp. NCCP-436]|uniref:bifunctional tetrahydrofolate synthase/dihydrofolate synthase n=1 Tax=Pseudomonas sp. NCCP-436 TaxID=2842481 RepID=UPI001C8012DA|nr:bifunctional tetrahydrofolate synthase/dihydrofolate synthase [Pseudomonas sp. NCCP-436]GIZ13575.1 bifunctional folylpolyglutamate synthase/dihydrofolate synthase [Pseudomonas sp. NCCP-436]
MSERNLGEWLAYLEGLHPTAIDMGLERSREVAQRLTLGRPAPRVITVTGTNGKGSTCAFLANLLRAQGLRVGLYSSPHLLRYNERVELDGREASDVQLCQAFAAVESARGEISLTYFEMGTLAAFWLFQQSNLDAVVLEVGLGGRLDAVNLIDADLALITSIGLDHVDWLGDSRDSVAYEKAGIMRPGRPALCGDLNPPAVLLEQAATLQAPLLRRGTDYDLNIRSDDWSWFGCDESGQPLALTTLPLLDLPLESAALALQAYALLGLPWDASTLIRALESTHVPGRLDRRALSWQGKSLTLLLDVGHNPHAAEYLARRLQQRPLASRRRAVFALLADKDLSGVVAPLLDLVSEWVVAPLNTPRSRAAEELAQHLRQQQAVVEILPNVRAAIEQQCERAGNGEEILVFGSFFCVAEALEWLAGQG